jgi:hypothetical protein
MYAGTVSGAVTIGLALFLIIMSQKPNASETETQPPPEIPAVEKAEIKEPSTQTAVVLPSPPAAALPKVPAVMEAPVPTATATAPTPPPYTRPPLKPRKPDTRPETVEVTALKPRPKPAPPEAAPTPEPKPVPAPEKVLPELAPPEQVASLPETAPNPSTAAQSTPVSVTRKTVKEGRALLKILEVGKGPVIEIAWPRKSAERARLYRLLTSCHGMQTAMLADGNRLYAANTTPGQTWNVNRDAVSGFIRKPAGELTEAERSVIRRIRVRHGIGFGDTVRLFPRGVDTVVLGGLGQIVGPGYLKYKTIRARYQLTGDWITVVDVRVDGAERPGRVALPRTSRCN